MNVRIFWVRAMKCMYAQTRPRFILSSKGVLGGMEFEPMLTPREKSPLPKMSPEEDRTRDAMDSEPKHYQLSYSGPTYSFNAKQTKEDMTLKTKKWSRLIPWHLSSDALMYRRTWKRNFKCNIHWQHRHQLHCQAKTPLPKVHAHPYNNNNNNERISRVLFHVKHAQPVRLSQGHYSCLWAKML